LPCGIGGEGRREQGARERDETSQRTSTDEHIHMWEKRQRRSSAHWGKWTSPQSQSAENALVSANKRAIDPIRPVLPDKKQANIAAWINRKKLPYRRFRGIVIVFILIWKKTFGKVAFCFRSGFHRSRDSGTGSRVHSITF
jgi:hypothetical protein